MYVVTKVKLAWFDVEWSALDEEGVSVVNSFRMKAELVPLDPFEKFLATFATGTGEIAPVDFIRSVVCDWDEIVGEDKKPFPFTPKNLDIIIQAPGFLTGWQMSYVKAWHGQAKAREKNSGGSPAAGQAGGNRKARRALQTSSRPSPRQRAPRSRQKS